MQKISLSAANQAYLNNKNSDNTTLPSNENKQIENGNKKIKLALAALATVGTAIVAGVAIYKHKNNSQVIEKGKQETRKILNNLDSTAKKEVFESIKKDKYTGIVQDTLKNGDKVTLEYSDGVLKKSSLSGSKVIEKNYEVRSNGDKIVEITKGNNTEKINLTEISNDVKKAQDDYEKLLNNDEISLYGLKNYDKKYLTNSQKEKIDALYKKKIDAQKAEELGKKHLNESQSVVEEAATNLGTIKNPIQEEPLNIALGQDRVSVENIYSKNGVYYKQDLTIDKSGSNNLPSQGVSGAISDGYENYEIKTTLRRMQNKKATKDDLKDLIQKRYKKQYKQKGSLKEVEDEIYQDLINSAKNNLEQQKIELEKFKPSSGDSILWRGISAEEDLGYGGTLRKVINNNLKPGSTVVLDGATMCTSPNFEIARQYGREYIRIKAPTGSKLVRGLDEVRFPAMSEFKFVGKTNAQDKIIWDFEYVIPTLPIAN